MLIKLRIVFIVRMVCIRVNKQVGLVKRVTLHVPLVFPLLRYILVHLGVVTVLIVLKDVINGVVAVASIVVLMNVSLVVMIRLLL